MSPALLLLKILKCSYDEKITQKAAMIEDDQLNRYFFTVVYTCLDWDAKEKVTNFNIYEHTLNWASHSIFRNP